MKDHGRLVEKASRHVCLFEESILILRNSNIAAETPRIRAI